MSLYPTTVQDISPTGKANAPELDVEDASPTSPLHGPLADIFGGAVAPGQRVPLDEGAMTRIHATLKATIFSSERLQILSQLCDVKLLTCAQFISFMTEHFGNCRERLDLLAMCIEKGALLDARQNHEDVEQTISTFPRDHVLARSIILRQRENPNTIIAEIRAAVEHSQDELGKYKVEAPLVRRIVTESLKSPREVEIMVDEYEEEGEVREGEDPFLLVEAVPGQGREHVFPRIGGGEVRVKEDEAVHVDGKVIPADDVLGYEVVSDHGSHQVFVLQVDEAGEEKEIPIKMQTAAATKFLSLFFDAEG